MITAELTAAVLVDLRNGATNAAAGKKHGLNRATVAKIRREGGVADLPNRGRPRGPTNLQNLMTAHGCTLRQARKLAKELKDQQLLSI